jgi:D-xylonolactonase
MVESTAPVAVADHADHTGEGPIWHPEEEKLYWVDIPDAELYRYSPRTGASELVYAREGEDAAIGGFTLQADGTLLLFEEGGRVELFDDGATKTVVGGIEAEADSRFNDVIADPRGRVFCGTMPAGGEGSLYRLDADGSVVKLRDVGLPNGMGFSADRESFYFTDTERAEILRYDYEEATGDISNPERVTDGDAPGNPDGMTVDATGDVWSARWNGECLVRFDPDGTEKERVAFDARKVSSLVFAGPAYNEAYVTTALGPGEGPAGTRAEEGAGAGKLFHIDLGVRGLPEFRSRVGL